MWAWQGLGEKEEGWDRGKQTTILAATGAPMQTYGLARVATATVSITTWASEYSVSSEPPGKKRIPYRDLCRAAAPCKNRRKIDLAMKKINPRSRTPRSTERTATRSQVQLYYGKLQAPSSTACAVERTQVLSRGRRRRPCKKRKGGLWQPAQPVPRAMSPRAAGPETAAPLADARAVSRPSVREITVEARSEHEFNRFF